MAMSHEDKLDRQLDAEQAVIGSLLIDERIVREVLSTVDVRDFLNPTNRLIFQAARKLFRDGKTVDRFSIRDQVGSQYSDYMVQLMEITPTSANWREYAAMMHAQATLQRVRNLADKLATAVTLRIAARCARTWGSCSPMAAKPTPGPCGRCWTTFSPPRTRTRRRRSMCPSACQTWTKGPLRSWETW